MPKLPQPGKAGKKGKHKEKPASDAVLRLCYVRVICYVYVYACIGVQVFLGRA